MLPQWGDSMISNSAYEVAFPDNGNGSWGYTRIASECQITFLQRDASDLDTTQDDRAMTEQLLGEYLGATAEEVAPYAEETEFAYQLSGAHGVDALMLTGKSSEDGSNWLAAGRAFHQVPAGLIVTVQCEAGIDPAEEFEIVREKDLSILVTPALG